KRTTVGYALVSAISGGGVLAFVTGSPLVLLGSFHLSSMQFGIVFASITIGIMLGAWLNARLARRGVWAAFPPGGGLIAAALAGISMCVLAAAGELRLATMMPLLLVTTFCRGIVSPNAMHAAMEPVPERAGAASAVIGSAQMFMGSVAGLVVG